MLLRSPIRPVRIRAKITLSITTALLLGAGTLAAAPAASAAPAGPGEFATSFETADPAPTWTSTVDTAPDGTARADGVHAPRKGSIPGDVTDLVDSVTASAENPPNEVAKNLPDGDVNSKWLAFDSKGTIDYHLSKPTAVSRYALTTANDEPGRDPRDWRFQGSPDGKTWTTLDSRTGQTFADRFAQRVFDFSNTTAYPYYRLDISATNGADLVQLSEWRLSNGDDAPPPAGSMTTEAGTGPRGGYNSAPEVGWTGTHSLRYAGQHVTDGRAYSYNKVLDVDIPVTAATELSYKIFPDQEGTDLRNPSTYAAVDLAFTDGTLLSSLGAVDQHGKPLSPRGQGESKVLYTNQWNAESSRIGDVAAGKTVDRILVGYDNPAGPADFGGWIDDITLTQHAVHNTSPRPSDHVLTTRGTNASGSFSRGNNFPATALPHGFNFWTPVTDAGSTSWLYEYQKANDEQNRPSLQAFSLSHEPSPWMGDRQTFQVMPSVATGTPSLDRQDRELTFSHSNETARAHYYGVTFDNGLKAELTPTDHAAMFRFTFPGDSASLLFDNITNDGGLTLDAEHGALSGYTDVSSGGNSVGMTRMFVYATFDRPVTAGGRLNGGGRADVGGYLRFDAGSSRTVGMRIATSLISVDQAKHNLDLEISPSDTFDAVEARAQAAWDEQLGVIEVQGATEDQLTTLYSNLYRLNLYPNSAFENTGSAAAPVYRHVVQSSTSSNPAPAGTTADHTGAPVKDGKVYVNNGLWDTYRTTWPAYSLLYPSEAGEMVDGFVQQYKDGGWVSRWSSPGYADIMTGTSSDVAFADAYLKGVPGIDVQSMYDAALKNATVAPPNQNVGRKGLNQSIFLGYTPTSTGESASWALEGYLNDYGIANLSKRLYDTTTSSDPRHAEYLQNYQYFLNRSLDYVNLFNPAVGFFEGRTAAGDWRQSTADFDPRVWGNEFTESDGWNFAFHAVQDGQGLANLLGGKDKLGDKLDTFFSTPETAGFPGSYGGTIHEMLEARDVRLGQWGLSNQLSHHIPYMYDYAGEPSKAASVVREALSRAFTGSEIGQGYPGDEDNGELSAWQIFSSLGFYPLQMGNPTYAIGSPLYQKATIHLENGKDIVLNAPQNSTSNVYVQDVKVNGAEHSKTYFTQDELANGATIDFTMGSTPSAWGTGADDAPPSITPPGQAPAPLADATGPRKGMASTTSAGANATLLFDNSSDTRVTFPTATPTVQFALSGTSARASMYTLTSGSTAGDPKSWVLEGSNDGATWTTLDTRADQSFPWRLQTRAFSIASPQVFRTYRLRVTAGSGDTVSLAEVELLTGKPKVSEVRDAVAAAVASGGMSASLGRDAQADVAAAQSAEDKGDDAAVLAALRRLSSRLQTASASKLTPAARDAVLLVVSQWVAPASGVSGVRDAVAHLTTSGDIASSTSKDLQALVTSAEQAEAAGDGAAMRTALTSLRSAVAVAKASKVSAHAKDVLLPLIDDLLVLPGPDNLRAYVTTTSIGDDGVGNADFAEGFYYSRQALAAKGVVQGTRLTVPGTSLTYVLPKFAPGDPDSVAANGQTLDMAGLPATAKHISFVGAANNGDAQEQATLTYSDGSTAKVALAFGDWSLGGDLSATPRFGNIGIARAEYRDRFTQTNDPAKPWLFATAPEALAAGKTLVSITLPTNSRIKVFSIAYDGGAATQH
ncbi:putative alpha-1,2-mannosidase [Motilibacter peucedani]|uniref:Putative alpha-1,2-mannosidase n=1 Tax=Motilibacter peucedani TaxID=598650 RepID=A0A420XMZ8_9ACTN|nr:putative alpha-1,2-mannosidase [Motilibacter peucedani]